MRKICLSLFLVLWIIFGVSTRDLHRSKDVDRILHNQRSHLPEEAIVQGDVHLSAEEDPVSEEKDLGHSQLSSGDVSSGGKPRKRRESPEPPKSRDGWFLGISSLLIILLSVISCIAGCNKRCKRKQDVEANKLQSVCCCSNGTPQKEEVNELSTMNQQELLLEGKDRGCPIVTPQSSLETLFGAEVHKPQSSPERKEEKLQHERTPLLSDITMSYDQRHISIGIPEEDSEANGSPSENELSTTKQEEILSEGKDQDGPIVTHKPSLGTTLSAEVYVSPSSQDDISTGHKMTSGSHSETKSSTAKQEEILSEENKSTIMNQKEISSEGKDQGCPSVEPQSSLVTPFSPEVSLPQSSPEKNGEDEGKPLLSVITMSCFGQQHISIDKPAEDNEANGSPPENKSTNQKEISSEDKDQCCALVTPFSADVHMSDLSPENNEEVQNETTNLPSDDISTGHKMAVGSHSENEFIPPVSMSQSSPGIGELTCEDELNVSRSGEDGQVVAGKRPRMSSGDRASPSGIGEFAYEDELNISRSGEDGEIVTGKRPRMSSEDRVSPPVDGQRIGQEEDPHSSPQDPLKISSHVEDSQSIGKESSMEQTSGEDSYTELVQKTFLQKLMALDISARNTVEDNEDPKDFNWDSEEEDGERDINLSDVCNPLDVICVVLQNSDMILQQQIVSKMSMCQFAIPLLIPSPDRQDFTFMLWSMRDIVKSWRPHSLNTRKEYKEDYIVNVPMPVFSFVRLGSCNISKSYYLNQVLSPSQQNHNFFVHSDMPGGNIPRKHSNGLVEIFWYLPVGNEQIDVFPEPLAVMNLREDIESNQEQFRFLTNVSSAMFIFIEDINENQCNLISKLQNVQNVFFILNIRDKEDNIENLKALMNVIPKQNVLVKNKRVNDSQVVKKIRSAMKLKVPEIKKTLNLKQIAKEATELNIPVKECSRKIQEMKTKAKEITDEINDVNGYKKETMKLQGERWKEMSKLEKEICRMRDLGDRDVEEYKSELQAKIVKLQEEQRLHNLPNGINTFYKALKFCSEERKLFLKWMKIFLSIKGRKHLRELQNEYKCIYSDKSTTEDHLQKIDQKMADGSLGVEHFIRELAQSYEIQSKNKDTLKDLPEIAADLLLDGFPLELIDGDASNIPLQWITDVLTELDRKTGGECRMRVITVLGVQSTGKSTLLNTMFGLQFPVASGRCTRGAFMTLIKANNFEENLNCDFILVIDTEGLKSSELASLENSYEHDNELATVVVGLSDITIVNMAMENAEEMKDILQIVVHAFLRMKEIGKKSSCLFVHQNVSDVSAHVKNRNARQKFLEQLSEMAKVAARMEKRSGINQFSDIISCDIEKDSWYIPGLWYGIPPMASVNSGYSNMVSELKQSILQSLKSMRAKPQNIREFTEWIKSLWNGVKHEKFVFSFRNRLVTEAYNQLCIQYADWEWTFQKNVHRWMMETETLIYNLPYEKINADLWNNLQNNMNQILTEEEKFMHQCLEEYYESDVENAHLLETFRGDFFRSVKYLRKQLGNVLHDKCEKTIRNQKEKSQIQAMEAQYIDKMEEKISEIMEKRRNEDCIGNSEALEREFDAMWDNSVSSLKLSKPERRHVGHEISPYIKRDIDCDEVVITEWVQNLHKYKDIRFHLKEKHPSYSSESERILNDLTFSLIDKCNKYVEDITRNKEDFNVLYSQELLSLINKWLRRQDVQDLHITKLFELELKLHILGGAAYKFQKMHEDFVQRNDPRTCLEMLKPQYYSIFKNMYEKRDECRRKAEQFCDLCLKPAITYHIYNHLGQEIIDDILQISGPEEFKSRKHLQLVILEKLLNENSCEQYVEYINDYEKFLRGWISAYIAEHYKDIGSIQAMQIKTLHPLMAKVQQTLKHPTLISSRNINEFLVKFCNILEKELVISKNNMKVVLFQSNLNVKQFAKDVDSCLGYLQDEIQQELNSMSMEKLLSQLTLKPKEELFKMAIGCGKQCPFCKAPCEAGGADHKEHFTSLHRPRGLGQHKDEQTNVLDHSICSTNVISNKSFSNKDTAWKPHPYKEYRTHYPDWAIYPDMAANASDYWKFVLKELNASFAEFYQTNPAKIPEDWGRITHHQALTSLRTTFQ